MRLRMIFIYRTYLSSNLWSSLVFFMRICYMQVIFYGPYLSHTTRSACIVNLVENFLWVLSKLKITLEKKIYFNFESFFWRCRSNFTGSEANLEIFRIFWSWKNQSGHFRTGSLPLTRFSKKIPAMNYVFHLKQVQCPPLNWITDNRINRIL